MKALFLTNEYPPHVYGGAGIHVHYLTRELARSIPVEVRCFGDQASTDEHLTVRGFRHDPARFAACEAKLVSPLAAFSICVDFAAQGADASFVHCHTWYTHLGGLLVSRAYGIPLVITTHSLEPLRPWKREQLGRGYELSTCVERAALESADALVAVSQGMKDDILRLFRVDPARIHVIHNGIDTTEFSPVATTERLRRYGVDPAIPYVLFVGRITRQKGITHLLDAAAYLDPDLQLVLCAGQPDTEEIAAETSAKVRALQERRAHVVWIREWVDDATKVELYSHAAVFCCPSIYEPFGIINLEAMACGTPVVGSAVGGIREIIVDGETGYLVPVEQQHESPFAPLDPDRFARDLAAAIMKIARDPSLRQAMGAASRQRAEAVFSWTAIAQAHLALYESLLRAR